MHNTTKFNTINSPLVTVLIPCCNVERYIESSLMNVINQTYKNLEILVIDDGSTDNTRSILVQLAKKDKRINLIYNQENNGLIKSLNNGIEIAKGEYIARTDADDLVEKNWIEELIYILEKSPEILAIGAHANIINNKNKVLNQITPPEYHQDIIEMMPFSCPIIHPVSIIRSSVFKKNKLRYDENYIYAEDYKLWLEISKIGKLHNLQKILINYRIHENQVSSKRQKEQEETAKKIRIESCNRIFHINNLNISINQPISIQQILSLILIYQKSNCTIRIMPKIIYELCLSIKKISILDIITLFNNQYIKKNLSRSQHIKLIKKFIRPKKYKGCF